MRHRKTKIDACEDNPHKSIVSSIIFLMVILASLLAFLLSTAKAPMLKVYVPINPAIALSEKTSIRSDR